ncbi:MAG: hypothetical protein KIT72_04505 [Polyangiaceae bacterium]|nr:hypothetical protein [Polyangiaceae bacterium]MCW5789664.1 hypothetical protein [Polyangiaceae bacterium]
MSLNPIELSRTLATLAHAWQGWRRALRRGELSPLFAFEIHRRAVGRQTYHEVQALHPEDPLRAPLLRWVYRLAEQRINQGALLAREAARRSALHPMTSEGAELSLAALWRLTLAPEGGAEQRVLYRERRLAELARHTSALRDAERLLWERRREVASRMGHASLAEAEGQLPELPALAREWLDVSAGALESLGVGRLSALIEAALDRREDHPWPARLTPSSLLSLAPDAELTRGLRLDPGPLPEALGGASYLRALARLGAALSDAAAPQSQPFVVAHDPYGARRWEVGALLAALPLRPVYLRQRLGLSGARQAGSRRASAITWLIASRTEALRVLLHQEAGQRGLPNDASFEELTARAFLRPLDPRLLPLTPRYGTQTPARFAGMLLGAEREASLREAHDEDWFRNPRGVEQLRAELGLPPPLHMGEAPSALSPTELERARRGLVSLRDELLAAL